MKKTLTLLCFFFSVTVFASTGLDKIIVYVNDDIVTQAELQQQIKSTKQVLQLQQTPIPNAVQLRKKSLDTLINTKLELQVAEKMGIKVTSSDVSRAVRQIAKRNKVTPKDLYARVAEDGLSRKQYRENIRKEMLTTQVVQRVLGRDIKVNEQEVKNYLRQQVKQRASQVQYRVSRILLPLSEGAGADEMRQARKKANDIMQRLKQGVEFEQVSLLTSSGEQVDLGWRRLNELPKLFQRVKNMKVGQVAGPLQAQNGLQIIKLLAVRRDASAQTASAKALKTQAYNVLYQRKLKVSREKWLQQLQQDAYIKRVN